MEKHFDFNSKVSFVGTNLARNIINKHKSFHHNQMCQRRANKNKSWTVFRGRSYARKDKRKFGGFTWRKEFCGESGKKLEVGNKSILVEKDMEVKRVEMWRKTVKMKEREKGYNMKKYVLSKIQKNCLTDGAMWREVVKIYLRTMDFLDY